LITLIFIFFTNALAADWSDHFYIPPGGRVNPYNLNKSELDESVKNGKLLMQHYPVTETGLLPPYQPVQNFFEKENKNPLKEIIKQLFVNSTQFESLNDILSWIGLHPYPKESDQGVYSVPYPNGKRPDYLMGFGTIEKNNTTGFTISCAACHSSNLFGKTVLGMTNRFPKANLIFIKAKQVVPFVNSEFFKVYNNATDEEIDLLNELKANLKSVGLKEPLVLGLDTSLAQVALSLAHRNLDSWASKDKIKEIFPEDNFLKHYPADSKPAVWWNVKYKNRFLSDGSVSGGNPIFTNILWNEIGRGADLFALNNWIQNNSEQIRDLTNAVLSIEPPRITDFYSESRINLLAAQRGEKIFNQACAKCHGTYIKAWSLPEYANSPIKEKIKTVLVKYKEKTKAVDVGTDLYRYLGMSALTTLNELQISKNNTTLVTPQKGYVPPPLVGIWARWPYFHNNSIPNLCVLLTAGPQRVSSYYAGEANNPNTDFDYVCNGYPIGNKTPQAWQKKQFYFDSKKSGLSNLGHDEGIFLKNGKKLFTKENKLDLIHFLQTL
jgi:hypothetical protein